MITPRLKDQKPVYFIPPYEWYNADQSRWAKAMNVLLFNYSPGSGSNRDWAPETEKSFVPSQKIIDDILAYEKKDPHGLNGSLLLLHVGSQRKDKTFLLLDPLLNELESRNYTFIRIDQMLALSTDPHHQLDTPAGHSAVYSRAAAPRAARITMQT